jgi:hypothetical protein
MNLYIDKENLLSLIENSSHDLYTDCIKTIKNQLDVFFNFSKSEVKENEGLMAFLKLCSTGVANSKMEFLDNEKFPQRPLKSNTYSTFTKEQLSAIYLINDEKLLPLKEKGAVLVGAPGEEFEIFNQVFFFQSDYKFEKKLKIGGDEFSCWNDLQKYTSAVSDIIFIDQYILSDTAAIENNFIPFLKILTTKSKCKLNIVLYVNYDNINISYNEISSKTRTAVESITGVKPNFTIVKVRDKRGLESYSEHDRTVITNYTRIYSGDSFNYFKSNGSKITKGREIQFSSFGDNENHSLALDLIKDIQSNINKLPKEQIEGDQKSNYLTF